MAFGGAVKLTGESEYRRALSQITQNLKELSSEMKVVSSSFDSNDKSVERLTAMQDVLAKKYQEQTDKLNILRSQYASMESAYQTQLAKHGDLVDSYNAEKDKLEEIGRTLGTTSDEYKEQEKKVVDLANQVDKSSKANEYNEKTLSNLRIQINNAESDCNETAREMKNLGKETEETGQKAENAANGGFTVFKGVLANLTTQLINGAINGLKKLGSSFVNLGKQAVNSYAEYEQLVGGVETLFGDSSDQLIKYASEAYRTSGISANQYMQQATSFSASLLNSLGDDTEKAVEYSNRAMIDMADNANKMGTNIGSIQSAYQGFAKQNYTMLDNLKLGYGGTKTEMQRLIKDASEMTDIQKELGITVDANSMSFGNIVNAISIVQKKMGIAGTTIQEAEETISGSMGMMRAAWSNLLTGMADDNQDIEELINNLVDSIVAVAHNIIPRVKTVVKGIGDVVNGLLQQLDHLLDDEFIDVIGDALTSITTTITKALPKVLKSATKIVQTIIKGIAQVLPDLSREVGDVLYVIINGIVELLPTLVEMGAALIVNIVNGISQNVSKLVPALVSAISTAVKAFYDNLPTIVSAGVNLILALADGLIQAIPQLVQQIPTIISSVVNALTQNVSTVIQGGVTLLMGIVSAIPQIVVEIGKEMPKIILSIVGGLRAGFDEVVSAAGELFFGIVDQSKEVDKAIDEQVKSVGKFRDAMANMSPTLADYNKLLSDQGRSISEIDDETKEVEDAITDILKTAIQDQKGVRDEDLKNIEEYMTRLHELQEEKLGIYRSQQIAEFIKLQQESGEIDKQTAYQHLTNTEEGLRQANSVVEDMYTDRVTMIEQKYQAAGRVGSAAYQKELDDAKTWHDEQITENKKYYDDSIQIIQGFSKDWIQDESDRWKEINKMMGTFNNQTDDGFHNFLINANSWMGGFNGVKDDYRKALSEMDIVSANSFLSMTAKIKNSGKDIDDETKEIAKNILGAFDNLPDEMDEAGHDTLMGLIQGMKGEISELENASEMTSDEIVDTIKRYLGIASPSKVMMEVGRDTTRGLIEGMKAEQGNLTIAGKNLADGVQNGFLGQESTLKSKVTGMMSRIVRAVKDKMQIHSPSKVFAEIGDYMAQGIGVGFTDEMKDVTKDITGAMPTSIDAVGGGVSGGMSSYGLVESFKQALSEVKIVIDDEVAGSFVDRTVTNLIYT